jgi:hypothetical protein
MLEYRKLGKQFQIRNPTGFFDNLSEIHRGYCEDSWGILWSFFENYSTILQEFFRRSLGIPQEFFENSSGVLGEFFGNSSRIL